MINSITPPVSFWDGGFFYALGVASPAKHAILGRVFHSLLSPLSLYEAGGFFMCILLLHFLACVLCLANFHLKSPAPRLGNKAGGFYVYFVVAFSGI